MNATDERLLRSIRGTPASLRGGAPDRMVVHVSEAVDVRAIRQRLGLSQETFAARFGFGVASVRNWEQGRRQPDGATRAFLTVIEREPEAVQRALARST